MARLGGMAKTGTAIVATLAMMAALAASVAAQGIYTSGATGYDISYPQCGGVYPTLAPGQFGIVGVTSGHAFRHNACFADEYGWASHTMAPAPPASVYMNLNYAIGKTATGNTSGPVPCAKGDKACQAHNYGWNAAQDAYTYAQGQASGAVVAGTVWWLDIETANSWSSTASLNRADIQGAIDYLQKTHGLTVGIYSTAAMWRTITGSWDTSTNGLDNTPGHTPLPAWDGVGGTTLCGNTGFTGGPVWLRQSTSNGYDVDTAC